MKTFTRLTMLMCCAVLNACGSSPVETTGVPPRPAPPSAPTLSPLVETPAAPGSAAASGAPESPAAQAVDETPVASLPVKSSPDRVRELVWRLKAAKVQGPEQAVPKTIAQFKDPKSGAVTITRCWRYKEVAVTEAKTKGEVGAAEVNIRRASNGAKENLCAQEFAGKTENLNIIEGYYAGRTGDYLVIEGADVGEGLPQFQVFSLTTGKEVLKGVHHPREEFTVTQKGKRTSLTFFAKVQVKCELAEAGQECWKKVLAPYPSAKGTPMPDCAGAFKAAKAPLHADALVTMRAEVADLAAAKVHIAGGRATCQPDLQ